MVCNTDDDAEIGRAYLNQIAGTLADGVLVMNTDIAINDLCASATHSAPILLAPLLALSMRSEALPTLENAHVTDPVRRRVSEIFSFFFSQLLI